MQDIIQMIINTSIIENLYLLIKRTNFIDKQNVPIIYTVRQRQQQQTHAPEEWLQ